MNIIYFVTHDTGRFLGCYGRPIFCTPRLDAFAADGVKFNRAYCSAPCCGPSRACVITGRYSHVNGALGLGSMGWPLPLETRTLVDEFNDAGYETFHAGFCHERLYGEMRYQIDGRPGIDESYWKDDAAHVVDKAIDYLERRDRSRPFFMNLATGETHMFHTAADRHDGPVDPGTVWLPPLSPDLPQVREFFGHWYAGLRYVDQQFGRLLDALSRLGHDDDTLVVFTTDHGIAHNRAKGTLHEAGVEIALLMRPPRGLSRGYEVDDLIGNIDFMPTFLEAAGIDPPSGLNGRSFWPRLVGEPHTPDEQVFIERNFHGERAAGHEGFVDFYDPQRSVRTRDFSYIKRFKPQARPRYSYAWEITGQLAGGPDKIKPFLPEPSDPAPVEELYDLRHDPWEQWNLAERPEHQSVLAGLRDRVDRWMRDTDDHLISGRTPVPTLDPPHWPTRGKVFDLVRM